MISQSSFIRHTLLKKKSFTNGSFTLVTVLRHLELISVDTADEIVIDLLDMEADVIEEMNE